MIKVKKIEIIEFRGIRNLTIDFNDKNFAICGRNGTGKSGVVDALEFVLTGSVSRLSGTGTGGVTLKEHAPHVDSRNNPEKAYIILTVSIPSLSKNEITIQRSVGNPNAPIITPNTPDILEVLQQVAMHPEFTLSRRELIKYVISPPGERAKEVQALLRLDKVENLRTIFMKVMNSTKKEAGSLKTEKGVSQQSLLQALQITDLSGAKLLTAVNTQRSLLGLADITVLTNTTSLKDGLYATTSASSSGRVPKVQALADIKKFQEITVIIASAETVALVIHAKAELSDLTTDPAVADGITREQFLKSAIDLITDEMCPVCDTPWESEILKELIKGKLEHFDTITAKRSGIEKELEPLIANLSELHTSLKSIESYSSALKPIIDTRVLKEYILELQSSIKQIQAFLPLPDTIVIMESYGFLPPDVKSVITQIENAIVAIPDATKQDAARDYLTICQERLEAYRAISLRFKQAEDKAELSAKVHAVYAKVSTAILDALYKEVQTEFTELYRFINSDDEGDFEAALIPSSGKLSFDVDFYGRGFFPPGAYHSEGHQDGMGLCLYLALMKYVLGNSFTFAVLDDVLMSVDAGHRREVCKLLKDKFPNTQFILTTHDQVWLKHMKTAGLISSKSSIFFRNWDVDNGPAEWNDRDIWSEISEQLKKNNVLVGAGLLRNYLEFISSEICHQLRAPVEFHGDGHFDLGDLLYPAASRFSKLLALGESAATSWGQTAEAEAIKKRKEEFSTLVTQSQMEGWQTNPAIHYNEWANLEEKDFTPVANAFHNLIKAFFCSAPGCGSLIYVNPSKGEKEMLRCSCGTVSINLLKK